MTECHKINFFNAFRIVGIETGIWPVLYYNRRLCESSMDITNKRISYKTAYIVKCLSEVVVFSLLFHLLQFQYDRWIYRTVTGAINCARKMHCTPARALDSKLFTATDWKWQHAYLIDAVRQFGFPSLFVTISPYEWTVPNVRWLCDLMEEQHLLPQQYGIGEILNIAHILDQLVRGFMTGSNENAK